MRLFLKRHLAFTLSSCAIAGGLLGLARGAEPPQVPLRQAVYHSMAFRNGELKLINFQDPTGQIFDPGEEGGSGGRDVFPDLPAGPIPETPPGVNDDVFTQDPAQVRTASTGSVLQESEQIQTVRSTRRSPIDYDPNVRGYKFGQIASSSDGQYFLPARQDLDSFLGKTDPSLVTAVSVIPGPYGLRYGSGLAFVNVFTIDTPRYECGPEIHNRFGFTTRTNGGQTYVRDTVYGGDARSGYIVNYGHRQGSDYRDGRGDLIPSSYVSDNLLFQYGHDLGSDGSKVEVRYNHINQGPTEYFLAFFDVNRSLTDSISINLKNPAPETGRLTETGFWYNQTDFRGDNLNASKDSVRNRVVAGLNDQFTTDSFANVAGTVVGNLHNFGARSVTTYGEDNELQLRGGLDVRYVTQATQEDYLITGKGRPGDPPVSSFVTPNFSVNQPRSVLVDPGVFSELIVPWTDYYSTSLGGRLNWANTHVDPADVPVNSELRLNNPNTSLTQNDVLKSIYLTSELAISEVWTSRLGVGHGERLPNLYDRYSNGVFISLFQSGFTRTLGDLGLRPEAAWQIDASLEANDDFWRARAATYYSWIKDYNTYSALVPSNSGVDTITGDPANARRLIAFNTSMATLYGFELYGDTDLTSNWLAFSSLQYVRGQDESINQPLPGIAPLDGRLGLRWHDASPESMWSCDFGLRMVDRQSRAGTLRKFGTNDFLPVEQTTGGFTTAYVRGNYNVSETFNLVAGIDNVFDRQYIEHFDRRLTAYGAEAAAFSFAPGITPYFGFEWVR